MKPYAQHGRLWSRRFQAYSPGRKPRTPPYPDATSTWITEVRDPAYTTQNQRKLTFTNAGEGVDS